MSRYSFALSLVSRSVGAAYCAETTSSWLSLKYSAAIQTPGLSGSGAAMLSSFAASRSLASSRAATVDLESCGGGDAPRPAVKAQATTAAAIHGRRGNRRGVSCIGDLTLKL